MSHKDSVISLIKALEEDDKAKVLAHLSDDIIFNNMPMETVQGHDAVWQLLRPMHDMATDIKWELHNIAELENGSVMTERTDRYRVNDHWAEFKVMGIFEFRDDLICHWRDYFDLQQCMSTLK
ncbi:MAG: nuclear transport factor 2 family protein [Pseudomonadales bacterium]|nr:nuclear transport factor 2 family protein [Pseudomonadales bacterium]